MISRDTPPPWREFSSAKASLEKFRFDTHQEHLEGVKAFVEEVRGKIPVISATGFNTNIAVAVAQQSARWGVDAILALPPIVPTQMSKDLLKTTKRLGLLHRCLCSSTAATG